PRCRPMHPSQCLVEDEERDDLVRLLDCRGQGSVVVHAQVAREQDDGAPHLELRSAPRVAPKSACARISYAATRGLVASGGQAPLRRSGWSLSTAASAGQSATFSSSAAAIPALTPRRPARSNSAPKTQPFVR